MDIMLMVKNAFFCVAKAKADNPSGKFWLILLGMDRLEIVFDILRTMVGNDTNLNMYQTACQLMGTTEVAKILAQFPEWQNTLCRLKLPMLTLDQQVITDHIDHINPQLWCGDVRLSKVLLITAWKQGR
jgi:hypothetical protein